MERREQFPRNRLNSLRSTEEETDEIYETPLSTALDTDTAIKYVGGRGCFQLAAALLLVFSFTLVGQIIYGLSYLQDRKNIKIECYNSAKNEFENCSAEDACKQGVQYRFIRKNELVNFMTEIPDLICIPERDLTYQGMLYFVGYLFGSLIWLRLTDFWGRKYMVLAGIISHLFIMLIIQIKFTLPSLYVMLTFLGFHAALSGNCAYLLLIELVGPQSRALFCAMLNMIDGGGSNTLLPIYYKFAKNWWYLYWFNIAYTAAIILPLWLVVPESPKFLISQGKYKQARQIYKRIARCNRRQMFPHKLEGEVMESTLLRQGAPISSTKPKKGLSEICKHKSLKTPLIVIPFIWLTVDMVYYGINFGLGQLKGSIYMNGILSGAAELISYIFSGLMASYLGRKTSVIICFFISGFACIFYDLATRGGTVLTYICVLLGKFGAASNFNLVYLITTEMFPTVFRGTVFGISNVSARFGGIISPIIDFNLPKQFMYIFGALGLISACCSFLLRETKGQKMADTFEEQDREEVKRRSSSLLYNGKISPKTELEGYPQSHKVDIQSKLMDDHIDSDKDPAYSYQAHFSSE